MTPSEQLIAIAEACGIEVRNRNCIEQCEPHGRCRCFGGWDIVPRYTTDLNEMHEAEKRVQNPAHYIIVLGRLAHGNLGACGATAAQRAEAFLRVKGLWK